MIDVWHKFEIVAYGFHAILALMYVCDTYAIFTVESEEESIRTLTDTKK